MYRLHPTIVIPDLSILNSLNPENLIPCDPQAAG